jgi:hypothetical protein
MLQSFSPHKAAWEGCGRSSRRGTGYRGRTAIVILESRIGRLGKVRQLSEMRDAASLSRDGSGNSGQATEHYRPTNNLPLALTSFVGREREMAEASGLLRTERLLTLVGTGGSGTTRLALAVGPRGRGLESRGQGYDQRPNSRGALHKPAHGKRPHGIGLPQDRLPLARRSRQIRLRARPPLTVGPIVGALVSAPTPRTLHLRARPRSSSELRRPSGRSSLPRRRRCGASGARRGRP